MRGSGNEPILTIVNCCFFAAEIDGGTKMKKYLSVIIVLCCLLLGCRLTSSDDGSVPEAGSPEIDVLQNGISIPSGTGSKAFGGAGIGFSKDLVFTIKNTGGAALNLSGTPLVALSGTDAAQFSVKSQPSSATVAAGAASTFTLSFTPTSAGSKTATVTIRNNDENEGTYTFSVTGASGAPGTLDAGFGTSGIATLSLLSGISANQQVRAVVELPDGKIVIAGNYYNGSDSFLMIGRYTDAGVLDATFGSNGTVITGPELFGAGQCPSPSTALLDSEGRILVVGYLEDTVAMGAALMLLRYTFAGVLDSTFGTNGLVKMSLAGSTDVEAWDALLLADGKILIAGQYYDGSAGCFLLARFTSSGSLDTSFAASGYTINSLGGSAAGAAGVAVQSVGGVNKIYLGGGTATGFAAVRYNMDGTLDSSYGSSGVATWTSASTQVNARSMKVQADGKVLVAGTVKDGTNWDYAVARFYSDGSLDSGFGSSGSIIRDTPTATALEYEGILGLPGSGKIVLAGFSEFSSAHHMVVWSINADGSPDTAFGSSGFAYLPSNTFNFGLAIQNSGQILVCGQTVTGSDAVFTLAAYWP